MNNTYLFILLSGHLQTIPHPVVCPFLSRRKKVQKCPKDSSQEVDKNIQIDTNECFFCVEQAQKPTTDRRTY